MSNYIGHINATAERNINNYLKGLDIYEDIYSNEDVTEVAINTNRSIYAVERGKGFIKRDGISDNEKLINLLKTLATLDNKQLTDKNTNISTHLVLTGGKKVRIEGLIPPVVENPTINIRKHSTFLITLEEYLKSGFITKEAYEILSNAINNKKNILVVGGTNTGKTTMLNALIHIADKNGERLITIEEVPELQVSGDNVNRVQTIPGVFNPLQALRYCMRATPERIVFGEIREGESAYEFINGLNSGHPGGFSTIHADDGLGALKKLETYINSTHGKPMSEEIGMGIDIIVTVKMRNFERSLASIDICDGYNKSINQYKLKNLYLSDKEDNFEEEEKEKLINYVKEKLNMSDIQINILQRKSLEYLEEFILKIKN